ncbi:hypothetical protein ACFOY4_01565 [Actinomadura syzygii]|uniref:Uncharacterized protein n=1 Tax=Actinomadura syzygii TaxID=1427538 RepID=A0A5D0TT93_9ACTN|nr:hypothetical protein [Actinomadura syzygii]TYC08566.1 hypothetical protein FXF65_37360 [Actinomadura syzygii]
MTVAQNAIPTGAVAVQFTKDEAAALVEAASRAAAAKLTEVVRLGQRPDGAFATEAHDLAAAVRKSESLGVVAGLEIHARRGPTPERYGSCRYEPGWNRAPTASCAANPSTRRSRRFGPGTKRLRMGPTSDEIAIQQARHQAPGKFPGPFRAQKRANEIVARILDSEAKERLMDLGTKNPGVARFRAISALGQRDVAYTKAKREFDNALAALPHRHSGMAPKKEQSDRVQAADNERARLWDRLAALFDAELNRLGTADPVIMGEIADRIISQM